MLLAYFNLIYCWTYNNCRNKSLVKANKTPLYLREQCCWKILAALCAAAINFKPPQRNPKLEHSFANAAASELLAISSQNPLNLLCLRSLVWLVRGPERFWVSTCYLYNHEVRNFCRHSLSHCHSQTQREQYHIPHRSRCCIPEDIGALCIHLVSVSLGCFPPGAPTPPPPATIPGNGTLSKAHTALPRQIRPWEWANRGRDEEQRSQNRKSQRGTMFGPEPGKSDD